MECAVFTPRALLCGKCSAKALILMADANGSKPSLRRVLAGLMQPHPAGFLGARYAVLRGLGIIFLSAFYSYAYQIQGLIGPSGISPAVNYLNAAREHLEAPARYFEVPTIFWLIGAGRSALWFAVAAGLVCSILLIANVAPRLCTTACTLLFLSIISVSGVFSSYQSDGMLLEAGFIGVFFAPGGLRPGVGASSPPTRIARFMLLWEWFRIYFESGVVKLASGDPQWQDLTALDHYYENGPLPTWVGWYVQHLPHAFHAVTAAATLLIELVVVWAAFLQRRIRVWLFVLVTTLQIGIILTANYAFLNYLVLLLGVLLLDDVTLRRLFATGRRDVERAALRVARLSQPLGAIAQRFQLLVRRRARRSIRALDPRRVTRGNSVFGYARLCVLGSAFYATLLNFPLVAGGGLPTILSWPKTLFEPFRFANGYGLFAVMTRERFEIEFQGTLDGETYTPYPFRYKPQDTNKAPGIYAPYQPRFEWNLWFASLGNVRRNQWVLRTAAALLRAEPDVLELFAFDPFKGARPTEVRTVAYRYWFSTFEEHRKRGLYWRRELLGMYAPTLGWTKEGTIGQVGPWSAE